MNYRAVLAFGVGVGVVAGFVPALAHTSTPTGPVTIEVIGPDQTGFTPALASPSAVALSPQTLAAVRAAASQPAGSRVAGSEVAGSSAAGSRAAGPTKSSPAPAAPKRVTGLSVFLDAMQAGSGIGVAEIYGLGVSGFTTIVPTDKLPPQVVQAGFTVLAVPPKIFDQMKQPTLQGFASLRQAIAPLAAGNAGANALLTVLSSALISLGTNGKPLVNPLDAQIVQAGKFLLVMEEPA